MRIAIFDHAVVPTNAIGKCHLHLLRSLCHEHEFTVFSTEFENPCPERINWVRVWAPRPLRRLFHLVGYPLVAGLYYWWHQLRDDRGCDLVQMIETNIWFGNVSYSHFCHRAYLERHWEQGRPEGTRGILRWLVHWRNAKAEPRVFKRVDRIVVPSKGLATELASEYPFTSGKIHVIPNAVEAERMQRPPQFDREGCRKQFGVEASDILLVFCALGHFERKGLPLLLGALRGVNDPHLKLLVVGGDDKRVSDYKSRATHLGLDGRVVFCGNRSDVRPCLWASDGFAFPSAYEVHSLACLEAAAAGLPLLLTPFNGTSGILEDGRTGFLLERSVEGIADGLIRFTALSPSQRTAMGCCAQERARRYTVEAFGAAWREFYAGINNIGSR